MPCMIARLIHDRANFQAVQLCRICQNQYRIQGRHQRQLQATDLAFHCLRPWTYRWQRPGRSGWAYFQNRCYWNIWLVLPLFCRLCGDIPFCKGRGYAWLNWWHQWPLCPTGRPIVPVYQIWPPAGLQLKPHRIDLLRAGWRRTCLHLSCPPVQCSFFSGSFAPMSTVCPALIHCCASVPPTLPEPMIAIFIVIKIRSVKSSNIRCVSENLPACFRQIHACTKLTCIPFQTQSYALYKIKIIHGSRRECID